jgi:hypothetical protein
MKHRFRQPQADLSGYAALAVFVVAYVAALSVVFAPDQVKGVLDAMFP